MCWLIDVCDCQSLFPALTSFVQLVLNGKSPTSIRPFFIGANLAALRKKQGGVRTIAVGCTLRRLDAKVAGSKIKVEMGVFWPSARRSRGGSSCYKAFLGELDPDKAVLTLHFSNAFNFVRRDKMLGAVSEHVPDLYSFVHSAYSALSSLFWSKITLQSAGVKHGDPVGHSFFASASIVRMCSLLELEFSLFYLDDGTLGGSRYYLKHDMKVVEQEGAEIGLLLSKGKSEILCVSLDTSDSLLTSLPGAQVVHPANATLELSIC